MGRRNSLVIISTTCGLILLITFCTTASTRAGSGPDPELEADPATEAVPDTNAASFAFSASFASGELDPWVVASCETLLAGINGAEVAPLNPDESICATCSDVDNPPG